MTMTIVEKAKKFLLDSIIEAGHDKYCLKTHTKEMEKWAHRLKELRPEADLEIILLSVWLHDSSHYTGDENIDHAVRSEKIAREFLKKEGYRSERIDQVCHCIRAHRNRDVEPETLEAKIVACIDSASHMTSDMYISIAMEGKFQYLYEKIDRDYKDVKLFPEIVQQLKPLYEDWKKLVLDYQDLKIVPEQDYNK